MSIVDKCIKWNAARFEQEFNYNLAVELLIEETDELFAADTFVDVLDAVGDITFVAIGVMWKMGIPQEVIEDLFYKNDMTLMTSAQAYNHCCFINNMFITNVEEPALGEVPVLNFAAMSAFITALSAIRGAGMQKAYYEVCDAICDSNNTKEVKSVKTTSNIKANIDKGSKYIPPTEKLQKIRDFYLMKDKGKFAS